MNKILCYICLGISALGINGSLACNGSSSSERTTDTIDTEFIFDNTLNNTEEQSVNPKEKSLLDAYPNFISKIKDNVIYFNDSTTMLFDDGINKNFETRLDESDTEDMFFVKYRSDSLPPAYLADAGRSRCENLFKKMYGSSASAVQKNLVSVPWFGKTIKFTSINGASKQLMKVADEIAKYPELKKYMDCSGTFYWRPVRGAKRLSAHSYGIAIDIAIKYSDYWLWKNPNATETSTIQYSNRIPKQLVEIFERYGFIWGGAWYHFDTMHFEFRPEIIAYSKSSSD